jgi:hypothetical protein
MYYTCTAALMYWTCTALMYCTCSCLDRQCMMYCICTVVLYSVWPALIHCIVDLALNWERSTSPGPTWQLRVPVFGFENTGRWTLMVALPLLPGQGPYMEDAGIPSHGGCRDTITWRMQGYHHMEDAGIPSHGGCKDTITWRMQGYHHMEDAGIPSHGGCRDTITWRMQGYHQST